MVRITIELDLDAFHAAKEVLGTDTKVATINAALREVARRKQVEEMLAAFDSVEMDYSESYMSFGRFGGGRDLSNLEEKARIWAAEQARLADEAENASEVESEVAERRPA